MRLAACVIVLALVWSAPALAQMNPSSGDSLLSAEVDSAEAIEIEEATIPAEAGTDSVATARVTHARPGRHRLDRRSNRRPTGDPIPRITAETREMNSTMGYSKRKSKQTACSVVV